jgi:DNA-binding NarL/FixJ family response regulator
MRRILIVDDHAIVRSGIKRLLADKDDIRILEAKTGEEALALARERAFELVILDINLPGLGGLELLRRLLKLSSGLAVLVFSQHAEPIYATRAMEAGAKGFISKNASPEELLAALETVLAGGTAVEKDIASEIAAHEMGDNAYMRELTQRDLEILRLLAQGNSLAQIAEALGVAYKTVANTLSRIKEKLGVDQTADLIRIAIGRGLTDLSRRDGPGTIVPRV